jgi:phosphatidate cytidylyltransferase
MIFDLPDKIIFCILGGLSILVILKDVLRAPARAEAYLKYLWMYFLVFTTAKLLSFTVAVWLLALVSFVTLREYFSLLAIRLQDRWGLWGAYLAIPFMFYFIQIDNYGMFIVSIPIYVFLIIPFLVALGGEQTEGTVFSIGVIDFGLFLMVFCAGHIGYLMIISIWAAVLLVLNVAICDGIAFVLASFKRKPWKGNILRYLVAIPFTAALSITLSNWISIPWLHALILGAMIPAVVAVGRYAMTYIETDLGIAYDYDNLRKGRLINSSCSLLFAAPVVFHYIRYFLT